MWKYYFDLTRLCTVYSLFLFIFFFCILSVYKFLQLRRLLYKTVIVRTCDNSIPDVAISGFRVVTMIQHSNLREAL